MFYRMDRGGSTCRDLGVPPLTVVLRHARDGEPELTTQVSATHRSTLVIPELGEISFQLEVRQSSTGPWAVRLISKWKKYGDVRDFWVEPMTDSDRELELKDRPRGRMAISLESLFFNHYAGLEEHLEDEYHGHPV